jgi:DNA polymerase-3 subunit alpha
MRDRFTKSSYNIGMILNNEAKKEQKIIVGGIIETVKEITTKKGDKMAFITLSDLSGNIEGVVFPRLYKEHHDIIHEDAIVAVKAKVSERDGTRSIIVEGVKLLTDEPTTSSEE